MQFVSGPDLYYYVENGPLRYRDPSGAFWREIGEFFHHIWEEALHTFTEGPSAPGGSSLPGPIDIAEAPSTVLPVGYGLTCAQAISRYYNCMATAENQDCCEALLAAAQRICDAARRVGEVFE